MDCSHKTVLAVTIFSKVLHTPSMVGHFQFTAGGGGRGHSPGLSLITQKEVMHAVRLSANTVLALHVRWSLWVGTSCKLNTVMAAQLVQAFVFGEDLQGFKNLGLCGQCILTFRG